MSSAQHRLQNTGARAHALCSLLLAVPQVWIGLVSAYLGGLTAAAWRASRAVNRAGGSDPHELHRFLVLVPAHNEEQLIGATLASLASLDYPTSHYAVHVVADNCSDATAAVAARAGAEVHVRTDPDRPGKGHALSWLTDRLDRRDQPHDAVLVLDADTVVSPSFLRVMNERLTRGERVIQAHYTVRDPEESWVVAVRFAALAVRNYLRPLARTSFGGSAGLFGNGMVFGAEVMRDRSWSDHLTEDIELEAQLLLAGERVTFAPEAVVSAEMPSNLAAAASQMERWERGRLDVARRFVPLLLRAASRRGARDRLRLLDAAADQVVPPLSILAMATAASGAASIGLWAVHRTPVSRANGIVAVAAACAQAGYVVSALRMVEAPAPVWRALLRTPLVAVWKLGVWRSSAKSGAPAWNRTPRNG